MAHEAVSLGLEPAVLPIVWLLTGISCVVVIARVIVKTVKFHGLLWEDYLMSVSLALAIGYGVVTAFLCHLGLGLPDSEMIASNWPKFAENFYLGHALGFMTPLLGRISFCLYMMRVLGAASQTTRRTIRVIIALQVLVNLTISILVLTQCGTFHDLWKNGLEHGPTCIAHDVAAALALAASSFNALTDLYLTILPAVVVWKIKVMSKSTKLGIAATLGLSIFASVASICKVYYVYVMYSPEANLRVFAKLFILMAVEINIVIVVASMPVLAPLFLHHKGRGSIKQVPILPTYDVSAQSMPKDHFNSAGTSQSGSTFGSKKRSVVKYDSAFGSAMSITDDKDDFNFRVHELPMEDMSPAYRSANSANMRLGILEEPSEDGSPRESSGLVVDGDSPATPWDELPTPMFLNDNEQSLRQLC